MNVVVKKPRVILNFFFLLQNTLQEIEVFEMWLIIHSYCPIASFRNDFGLDCPSEEEYELLAERAG
jgi:hypothetical protein